MINYLDSFRDRMQRSEKGFAEQSAAAFIEKGTNSTLVDFGDKENVRAAIVLNSEKEPNTWYLYLYPNEPIEVGDYFRNKDEIYFVIKQEKMIANVSYNKFLFYHANYIIDKDEKELGLCFIGPLEKYVNNRLEDSTLLLSNTKPIVIFPKKVHAAKIGDEFEIGGRPWKIIEYDDITNPYICYCSVELTTRKTNTFAETIPEVYGLREEKIETLKCGVRHKIKIEDGYFASTPSVTILRKNPNSIEFKIPYWIKNIEITTKENWVEVTKKYKVV